MSLDNQGLAAGVKNPPPSILAGKDSKGSRVVSKRNLAIAELPELPLDDRELDRGSEALKEDGLTFSQMFEESQKGSKFAEGEVVEGQVVKIENDFVTIDIGYKSEGQVFRNEFMDNQGNLGIEPGDHGAIERGRSGQSIGHQSGCNGRGCGV